ncbi:MAG: FHA domain-containing protein [Anaerolineae bacterium]|nr:FHA domain-containing protein [Anaerolineae bacterium]
MENLIELWYLNSVAIIVPVIALAVAGYIWYDANQKAVPATNWLIVGVVSLAATLPAAWTALNMDQVEKELLQAYLDQVRTSQQLIGEDVTRVLEALAQQMGLTQTTNINYDNLEMFIYLSIAGFVGSVIAGAGYYRSASASFVVSPPPTDYPQTYQMPPTYPQQPPPPVTPPAPTATVPPSIPSAAKSGSPPLERTKLMAEPAQVVAWLVVRSGSRQGKSYPIGTGESVIGRDGRCQVVLDHESVSGQHAKIRPEHNTFWLYDLASTNGTFLNNQRIQRQRLEDGDEIRLGAMTFTFKEVR